MEDGADINTDIGTLPNLGYDDDGFSTQTSEVQLEVEELIAEIYNGSNVKDNLVLRRKDHEKWLRKGLRGVSAGYQGLDASRPWIVFWILHAMELLGMSLSDKDEERVADFLSRCQGSEGGFAGGPGQLPHLAPTYAAVHALAVCGSKRALSVINRPKMYQFLLKVKRPDGSFVMHDQGETDVRGCYCALTVAYLLNIMTPELVKGTAEHIARCQSYEGGFGAEPGNEAHGGYTFCALAALVLLKRKDTIDLPRLTSWAVSRQMKYEGGFQGRTNKLVDSCYSLWQGGVYPLIDALLNLDTPNKHQESTAEADPDGSWLFGQRELQKYILLCCQDFGGGIRDKPGKHKDYYHTCYGLSGLSISQHNKPGVPLTILGDTNNLLEPTHFVFNIHTAKVLSVTSYFADFAPP
eukprot:TRINITY_DN6919_c0_g1_i1.p1 TRINITY_DN6919_c0_g1~~TRINITY_DN6919_c0_g1_i1.p1  ORF type:complete len:409 (+),score=40.52 TRINITY_DN6919_c0_g1_i1:70-1296(+)